MSCIIAIALAALLIFRPSLPAFARAEPVRPSGTQDNPPSILTTLNTNADPALAPQGTSLHILDIENKALFEFPLTTSAGEPIAGQPMHTAITADGTKVYVTMGGNQQLSTRIAVVNLNWLKRKPNPTIAKVINLLPPGTQGNEANGASCHPGEPGIRQEGHGPQISKDGQYLMLSELQNNSVVTINTATDAIVSETHPSDTTFAPHGLYPNPSGSVAASPQYWYNKNSVSLWDVNTENGEISFRENLKLENGELEGSYLHTIWWLDDDSFITNATQDSDQGNQKSERSVWLVNIKTKESTPILKGNDLLEGASDTIVANNKLYVAEGNVAKFLSGENAPGHLSVWDFHDQRNPTLIKRLSPGTGLPDSFANAHSLARTHNEKTVFLESFSSNYLLQINSQTDEVEEVFSSGDGLINTHGLYITDQSLGTAQASSNGDTLASSAAKA